MRGVVTLGVLIAIASCDFDGAFERYCDGNDACEAGSGGQPGGGGGDGGVGGDAGEGGGGEGGEPIVVTFPETCSRARPTCRSGYICDQWDNVCMKECDTAADCTGAERVCEKLLEWNDDLKVCVCGTTPACAAVSPGSVCNDTDDLCQPLCTSDEDCASYLGDRVCRASGECLEPGQTCQTTADCDDPRAPYCDPQRDECANCRNDADCQDRTDGNTNCWFGDCRPPPPCDPTDLVPDTNGAGGPDNCAYGEWCEINRCVTVDNGACAAAAANAWDLDARGPVIISALPRLDQTTTLCPGQPNTEITLTFYAPTGFSFDNDDPLPNIALFDSDLALRPADLVRDLPASGLRSGTFRAIVCGAGSVAGWGIRLNNRLGVAGNTYCIR